MPVSGTSIVTGNLLFVVGGGGGRGVCNVSICLWLYMPMHTYMEIRRSILVVLLFHSASVFQTVSH